MHFYSYLYVLFSFEFNGVHRRINKCHYGSQIKNLFLLRELYLALKHLHFTIIIIIIIIIITPQSDSKYTWLEMNCQSVQPAVTFTRMRRIFDSDSQTHMTFVLYRSTTLPKTRMLWNISLVQSPYGQEMPVLCLAYGSWKGLKQFRGVKIKVIPGAWYLVKKSTGASCSH